MYLGKVLTPSYFIARNSLLLIALLPLITAAQTSQHYVRPDFYNTGGDLQIVPTDLVRMISSATNDNDLTAQMYQTTFAMTGEQIDSAPLDSLWGETGRLFATLPLTDGSVVILAHLDGCDYTIPPQLAYYNAQAELLWHTFGEHIAFVSHRLTLGKDSVIVLQSDDHLEYFDMHGAPVGSVQEPYDIQLMLPSGFLVTRGETLLLLNQQFIEQQSVQFNTPVKALDTIPGGGVVVLTDAVYVIDELFNIVHQESLTEIYSKVISTSNGFWLFNTGGNILHLGAALEEVSDSQLPFAGSIRDVVHAGDVICISGIEEAGWGRGLFFVRTEATAFLQTEVPDAGIADIEFQGTSVYSPSAGGCYRIAYGSCDVTLSNPGETTIHSIDVSFTGHNCACDVTFHKIWQFDDLDLAPDATTVLTLNDLVVPSSYILPMQFCLRIDGPNNAPDRDHGNNTLCTDVDLVISATADVTERTSKMTIAPNPASSKVSISTNLRGEATLAIVNLHGQTVKELQLTQNLTEVAVSDLTEGVYYFIVHDARNISVVNQVVVTR